MFILGESKVALLFHIIDWIKRSDKMGGKMSMAQMEQIRGSLTFKSISFPFGSTKIHIELTFSIFSIIIWISLSNLFYISVRINLVWYACVQSNFVICDIVSCTVLFSRSSLITVKMSKNGSL